MKLENILITGFGRPSHPGPSKHTRPTAPFCGGVRPQPRVEAETHAAIKSQRPWLRKPTFPRDENTAPCWSLMQSVCPKTGTVWKIPSHLQRQRNDRPLKELHMLFLSYPSLDLTPRPHLGARTVPGTWRAPSAQQSGGPKLT